MSSKSSNASEELTSVHVEGSSQQEEGDVVAFVVGDPHFMPNIVLECDRFSEEVIKKAHDIKPDIIVILGDMLHEHEKVYIPAHNAIEFLIRGLRAIAPVYLLIGNHDYINNKQYLTKKHIFGPYKEWENVKVIDYPLMEKVKGKLFTFCPYVPQGRFIEALNTTNQYDEMWEMSDAIFAHVEVRGVKAENGEVMTKGNVWHEDYPFLVLGHIHTPQAFDNIFCPGSSRQTNFSELDERGVCTITFTEDGHTIKKVPLGGKVNVVVKCDVNEAKGFDCGVLEEKNVKMVVQGNKEQKRVFKKSKEYLDLVGKGVVVVFEPSMSVPVFVPKEVEDEIDILRVIIKSKSDATQAEFERIEKVLKDGK